MSAILALDASRRNVATRNAGASPRERALAAVVLHATWQPSTSGQLGAFVVWGESWRGRPARRPSERSGATTKRARLHPFAASIEELRASLAELGSGLELPPADSSAVILRLPSTTGSPVASPDLPSPGDAKTGTVELTEWRAPALHFRPVAAARLLLGLAAAFDGLRARLGGSARFWISPAQLGLELLHRQRFLPVLREEGGAIVARWLPQCEDVDTRRISDLARVLPPVCRAAIAAGDEAPLSSRELVRSFVAAIVDGFARESLSKQPLPKRGATRRGGAGRSLGEAWLTALSGDPVVAGDEPALARFYERYRDWVAPAFTTSPDGESFRVCFRLEPPEESPPDAPRAAASHDWTLRYLLQATDDPSLLVPATQVWRQRGSTAKLLDRKLQNPQEHLLRGLGVAARIVPAVETSLRQATPGASRLTTEEAYDFVRERALLLKSSGFGVLVPGFDAQLGVRVTLGRRTTDPARASGIASFGWESLVSFDWKLALGDVTLTREELEALARLKQPLVQIRGRWVELRREQIAQALAFFSRTDAGELTLRDALGLALAPGEQTGLPVVGVVAEGWFAELLDQLRQPAGRAGLAEPPGFVGSLRGYQRTGVAWLSTLRSFGLGACLADDMGLGKTIQIIALLLAERQARTERESGPTLLICPTSVVGNWRRELAKFAPSLRVLVHHGATRSRADFATLLAGHDVVISTYALLHRDEAELAAVEWSNVILDEAQNVKNAGTRAAQVARSLKARWRAALTGTPVENRLSELWSIFQFANPGWLGAAEDFRRRYANPIERGGDAAATARLKALVAPFILRRVKTDRAIIDDLPEKNELKVFCTLTKEQATLYEAIVRDAVADLEGAEGIQRRGQILATITKLKQVCDHPALFLHDGSELADRSGKLTRLVEMLEEVAEMGDRALVFTQYAEMGKLLKEHLEQRLGRETLLLHGGTPAVERERMVNRFQNDRHGPPVFVLSIKAGGTGLNLTRANHVFHFDRWWNPAVENQATDRAFRIGQRKDVQVHKFICAGTFEETIDQLIERKLALSESIVGAGEAWITELSNEQLRELFRLRPDAVAGE